MNQANAIGETPLHIALRQDHYECALYLITRGARLDVANNQGHLPANCIDEEKSKAASLIQLGTTLQRLMEGKKSKFLTEKTVSLDLSNGKETIPITAINGEDLDTAPAGYVYVKNNVITNPLPIERNISKLQHCKCTDNCASEENCKCCDMSVRSWFDSNSVLKESFDFSEPPMIFECNDMCSCNVNTCNNRVVQHGITARMQVYKTYGMGWGVKSLVDIPRGGFVCEYVGELISDAEAEQRENDSYLFDLENRDGDTFCIDANKFGNVTRFINHSCDPNLVPVKVFTSHQDLRFPHIAMFASRNIKKGDILGFDYGEKFWVIKHKFFTCWCGLEKCKYSKQAIVRTLDAYYKKNPEEVTGGKEKEEERNKQTGKLKLKLKMEEGKVVKVDDSLLLPDEKTKQKSAEKRDKPAEKKNVENGVEEREKRQKVVNGTGIKKIVLTKESAKEDIDSSDSDVSKKSSKKKEKSVEKEKAIIDLEEKITQIKGKILQIKKIEKIDKLDTKEEPKVDPKKDKNEKEETNVKKDEKSTNQVDQKADKLVEAIDKVFEIEKSSSSPGQTEDRSEEVEVEEELLEDPGKDILRTRPASKSEVQDEISKEITESLLDAVLETKNDVAVDVAELIASDTELDSKESKYYCSNCSATFDRDDKMLFHQEECIKAGSKAGAKTDVKTAENTKKEKTAVSNQCPKCLIIINKKAKLIRHARMCKGKKSSAPGTPSAPTPPATPELRSEKKVTITNIDEAVVENVIDATSLEDRESKNGADTPSTESPVPSELSDEGTRRSRGRPKKPVVDVSNILDKIPPTVNLKRVSSTSLRSSASSSCAPTSESTTNQNSEESSENSSGVNSRPKRSRKAVDKDL